MENIVMGTVYILGVFSYNFRLAVDGIMYDIRQGSPLGNPLLTREQRSQLFKLDREGKKKARLELVKRYREEVIPYVVEQYKAYQEEVSRIRKGDAMADIPKMNDYEKAGYLITDMVAMVKEGKAVYLNGDNKPDPCHGEAIKGYILDTIGIKKKVEKVAEKKSPFKAFNIGRFGKK